MDYILREIRISTAFMLELLRETLPSDFEPQVKRITGVAFQVGLNDEIVFQVEVDEPVEHRTQP